MPTKTPIGPADYDKVKKLHAKGLSRNEIARKTGRSGRSVSRIAAQLGLTFERGEQVKAATEARKIDAKARRAALAVALAEDAERLRQQLWAPCIAYNFGGKDNTFEQARLDEPSFADKAKIMSAIGIAVDRSVKLDAYDKVDETMSTFDLWLASMGGA